MVAPPVGRAWARDISLLIRYIKTLKASERGVGISAARRYGARRANEDSKLRLIHCAVSFFRINPVLLNQVVALTEPQVGASAVGSNRFVQIGPRTYPHSIPSCLTQAIRILLRDGVNVRLTPKAFETLLTCRLRLCMCSGNDVLALKALVCRYARRTRTCYPA
jgi:hypothetical protein